MNIPFVYYYFILFTIYVFAMISYDLVQSINIQYNTIRIVKSFCYKMQSSVLLYSDFVHGSSLLTLAAILYLLC